MMIPTLKLRHNQNLYLNRLNNMETSRNDLCPCGSGKKFKKCCMSKPKDDSEDVAKKDWRIKAIAALAKPFSSPWTGGTYPVGTAVIKVSSMEAEGNRFRFCVPSAPALFLDLSKKSYKEAARLKSQPNFFNIQPDKVQQFEDTLLFDFLEQMMASIVFAYSSIESFTNSSIPEGYIHKVPKKDPGSIEEYTKERIERYFSLEKKLELLPLWSVAEGVKSPKGTKLWQRFQALEVLRDRIIHLKSADLEAESPTNPEPQSIWQELVKMPETFQSAYDLLSYYVGSKPPRWLWKFDQT